MHFMSSYYSSPQLADIGPRLADDTGSLNRSLEQIHAGFARHLIEAMEPPDRASYILHLANNAPNGVTKESSNRGNQIRDHVEERTRASIWREIRPEAAEQYLEDVLVQDRNKSLDEQLRSLQEFIRIFGSSRGDRPVLSIAMAQGLAGSISVALDRPETALPMLDEAVRAFELLYSLQTTDRLFRPPRNSRFARAMKDRGTALYAMGEGEESLRAFNRTIQRFGNNEEIGVKIHVAEALLGKAKLAMAAGKANAAMESIDEIVGRIDSDIAWTSMTDLASTMIRLRHQALVDTGRLEEIDDAIDEIVDKFSHEGKTESKEIVAYAQIARATALEMVGRAEEGLRIIEEVVESYNGRHGLDASTLVMQSLLVKVLILFSLDRSSDALRVVDEAIAAIAEWDGLISQNMWGHINQDTLFPRGAEIKAHVLLSMSRNAEAVKIVDNTMKRLEENRSASDGRLSRSDFKATAALLGIKARAFAAMGELDKALGIFTEIVRRIGKNRGAGRIPLQVKSKDFESLRTSVEETMLDTARRELEREHFGVALAVSVRLSRLAIDEYVYGFRYFGGRFV